MSAEEMIGSTEKTDDYNPLITDDYELIVDSHDPVIEGGWEG